MRHASQDEFTTAPTDGALARALGGAAAWLRRVQSRGENRRTAETLISLDDYLLRDIGITRDEAARLSRGDH